MRLLGRRWEKIAERHLTACGLSVLKRNFNGPRGEIDLIMLDDEAVVFVEVKYRASDQFGPAHEAVDRHKQERLIHTARYFLMKQPQYLEETCRFDVVSITGSRQADIEWLKSAFDAD